ncbi:MAG: protein kinase, partial [Candidatus Hydrogenedentes bacterium]|nr:protein kinase [Candidatus Hydrogenedentota bacterium]
PSNVMIGEFGETIVLDWGIARVAGDRPDGATALDTGMLAAGAMQELADEGLTRPGEHLGTPHYMAPEQFRHDAADVTKRADVYALGAVLYELLCGRRRFEGNTLEEVVAQVLNGPWPSVRSVEPKAPADLAAICERAMAYDPADRYASAEELAEEVRRFQTGAIVDAYEYTALERLKRYVRRHWRGMVMGVAALTAVIAVTAFAFLRILNEQERTERALYVSSIGLAKASIDTNRLEDAIRALDKAPPQHRRLEWGLLYELAHPETLVLKYHDGPISDAQYSPDGTMIATCGHDGRLALWDARTGERLRAVAVHETREVHRLDWSPDSARVATATADEVIEIRDAATLTLLRTLSGYAPAFGANGEVLAAATGFGKRATVFDVATGAVLHDYADSGVYIIWLDISKDGRWMAAGNSLGTLHVWDLAAGKRAWVSPQVHYPSLRRVEFSADGRLLLTAGADKMARLWEVESGTCIRTFDGREGGISGAAALTPDGQWLVTGGNDRKACVWDTTTGKLLWQSYGYPAPLGIIAVSPDGQRFITSDGGSGRAVFPIVPDSHQRTLSGHRGWVWTAVFSPNGALLATGGGSRDTNDNRILLWDTASGRLRRTIETGSGMVQSLAFCDGGRQIVTASTNGKAVLYDVETGEALHTFPGHEVEMDALAVSPDNRFLLTTSTDKKGIIWDLAAREPIAHLGEVPGEFMAAAFHPSGRLLATAERYHWVRIWEAPGGTEVHAIPIAQRYEPRLAFSPDGRWLATGSMEGAIHLWEVETWQLARTFEGHSGYVSALAFNVDSRRLASGGKDNAVRIWDVDTGEQMLCIERHSDLVNTVAFSPDGAFLATGGRDGTAVLWPIASWQTDGADAQG